MSQLAVQDVIPSQAIFSSIKSSSQHIRGRALTEIRPQGGTSYSYNTQGEMIFNIASQSDFIDFNNSYMRFELTCEAKNGANDVIAKYLSEGGAHALFKTLNLTTVANVLVQNLEDYARFYVISSNQTQSPQYVNNKLWRAGDSSLPAVMESPDRGSARLVKSAAPATATTMTWTAASGTLTLVNSVDLTKIINIGDYVEFDYMLAAGAASGTIGGVVATVAAAVLTFDLSSLNGIRHGTDIAAGSFVSVHYWPEQGFRLVAANNTGVKLCCQLEIPFMTGIGNWFPLFTLRGGLRLRAVLNRPEYSLVAGGSLSTAAAPTADDFKSFNFTISNPVFLADMITPDQQLVDIYMQAFNTVGIQYAFPSYRKSVAVQATGAQGNYVFQLQPGVRSAKYLMLMIQDDRANTVTLGSANPGKSTYTCDCVAQGLDTGITELQVQIGSSRYPLSSPVDYTNSLNCEVQMEAERALSQAGSLVYCNRAKPELVSGRLRNAARRVPYNREHNAMGGPIRYYPIVELSRHTSAFSGSDASLNSIDVILTRGSAYSLYDQDTEATALATQVYYHSWVVHDTILSISSAGVTVWN